MSGGEKTSLMQHFNGLEDTRRTQGRRHNLMEIIAMTACAILTEAEGWDDVKLFAECKADWFRTFLDLPNGIPPSHDTFGDVFSRLDPEQFQSCFVEWTQAVAGLIPEEVVAIGSKTVRCSHEKERAGKAIHLVSA